MPFTPLHMGPAAVLKLAGGRRFSFAVFGFAQVTMDLEPLVRLLRGDLVLHGFSHSYPGAVVLGVPVALLGKPVCERILRLWNARAGAAWLQVPAAIPWSVAAGSALVGTASHVFLDSIEHPDLRPWQPFGDANGLLYAISPAVLHVLCFVLAGLGLAGLVLTRLRRPPDRR